ncbi:MFS transporter [Thermomonospora echinospora]|uniref:MFS transporter n=1 Tax=Thermomonospora echinospora TaxID=1992 RepID=UPI001F2750F7|nr:MFS transporter [Thermomonospora echinospora]
MERQATYREVFAIGEFRALWLAQTLSYVGDQLAQVALAVLVYHRTGSPLLTAVAYALTYLPPIVGGPVLSGLADLFPRRTVMVVCDVLRAGLVALMALQAMPFAMLCALVFLTVLLGAPFTAARAALLPDVLHGDRYVAGSAINNITHQATQMLGFLGGGALVAAVGIYEALAIDAVTFALSGLVLLLWLRPRPAPRESEPEPISLWRNTRAGARLVFGDPTLRFLVSFAWLCTFYVIPEGLAAPYAATYPGSTAVTVGLLMSAMPTGMVVGAFVFSRFVRPSNRIRAMGWMSMLACAPLIGSGLHPPLWAVVALWALSGVGSAYQLAANAAFVAAVPPSGRGQAFGLAQSGILAGQGLGILVGGFAAEMLGPQTVVALAGVAGLSVATMLAIMWTPVRGEVIASMFGRPSPAAFPDPADSSQVTGPKEMTGAADPPGGREVSAEAGPRGLPTTARAAGPAADGSDATAPVGAADATTQIGAADATDPIGLPTVVKPIVPPGTAQAAGVIGQGGAVDGTALADPADAEGASEPPRKTGPAGTGDGASPVDTIEIAQPLRPACRMGGAGPDGVVEGVGRGGPSAVMNGAGVAQRAMPAAERPLGRWGPQDGGAVREEGRQAENRRR